MIKCASRIYPNLYLPLKCAVVPLNCIIMIENDIFSEFKSDIRVLNWPIPYEDLNLPMVWFMYHLNIPVIMPDPAFISVYHPQFTTPLISHIFNFRNLTLFKTINKKP
jgi:hypothetical protein